MPNSWNIREIRDFSDFLLLREQWDGLLPSLPFYSHAYVQAWWEAFGQDLHWRVLVVQENDQVRAIFPFTLTTPRYHGIPVRQLAFFRNQHILRSDALLSPAHARQCLHVLLDYLRQRGGDWDLLLLDNVPENSPLFTHVRDQAQHVGLKTQGWTAARQHRFLPISGTWEDYLQQRSSNFRWQMKKFQKRLQQAGDLRIERVSDRQAMQAALPQIFALEQRSWQGQESGAAMQDADRVFQAGLLQHLPGEYWLLRMGETLAASITTLCHDDVLYVFTTYYAPEHAAAAPGAVLYFEMLKSAWERGMKGIDFNGDSHAFRRWTPHSKAHHRLHIYSDRYRGRLLHLAKQIRDHVRKPPH